MKKNSLLFILMLLVGSINAQTFTVDGISYTVTAPGEVQVDSFQCYTGNLVLPSTVTDMSIQYSVTRINDYAFYNCSLLTSVIVPNSITSFGTGTFRDCHALTSATLPNSLSSIAPQTFLYCDSLISVNIPDSVTNLDVYSFYGCNQLTSISIPDSVTIIGEYAFYQCTLLASVTFPNFLTTIGGRSFASCPSLTTINIPSSVTSIGDYAFFECFGLTSVTSLTVTPIVLNSSVFLGVAIDTIPLYVPATSLIAYQTAEIWQDFNPIEPIVVPTTTYYQDIDNDGYGNSVISVEAETQPDGYVLANGDCDDNEPLINPGAAEVCYDGIDNNCDGNLSEGCTPVLTQILPRFCGSTLAIAKSNIGASIATYSGPYTVSYLFRITNLTATPQVTVDLPRAFRNFNLGMTNIIAYGSQYSVMVAAVINGEQQPFSAPCLISTPSIPTSRLLQCGGTASTMTSPIGCQSVNYALAYQFEVAQASNPGVVKEFERLYSNFSMLMVTNATNALPLLYDTDYIVRVKVKVLIDGEEVWGDYGSPCVVRTPLAPEAYMVACIDGSISPISLTQILYSVTIPYATLYRFTLYNDEGYSQVVEHNYNSVTLSDFDALSPLNYGTTYSIIVDPLLYGSYYTGNECQVNVPPSSKSAINGLPQTIAVKAYPNPFANNFNIDVTGSNQEMVGLKVYDMIGRLIEQREVKVADLENSPIGDQYPSGVYNIIVTQEDEVKTVRVVKK